jgi:dolichol-phosphate mannosyltransferase
MPTPPASSADDPYDAARQQPQTQDADAAVNDTTSPRPLVTVATYNEIENLPRLVTEIFQHAPQADLLVIDDNSPDGTGQWCDEYAADDTRLHCLHREGKLGLGSAIVAGMKYAIEHDYDYVLNMDADFSHNPRYIPDLLAGMDRDGQPPVDVMIGSRYVPGGGIEGWPLQRHLMSRGVNFYARWLLSLRPKDCSGGYRCYRTSKLAQLDLSTIRSLGYSFQEEILWRLKRLDARFDEAPIVFVDRQHGQSKIDRSEALAALHIIFRLALRNWTGV